MMDVDRDKLRQKIYFIERELRRLEEIGRVPLEDFKGDIIKFHASVRCLQVAIEAMMDTGNHIIARRRLGIPKTYGEVFRILTEEGVIPREMLDTCLKMVKFRNRAVHLYEEIEPDEVYEMIHNNPGDFRAFIAAIVSRFLPPE